MIPLLGFTPDIDPTTPGAIVDCANIIPTTNGIEGAPTPLDVGLPALAAQSRGAALLLSLDGQRRGVIGTATSLFAVGTSSFTDISKVGGYTDNAENKWRFAQFGNASLATNGIEKIQASTSVNFDDIADAPVAKIIDVASGFVMAFNISSALVGDLPHGWACSGIYDHTTWTPATSNLAAWGMLMDTPGEIVAGRRLGQDVVAYKERSMYLGRFVGAPVVWQWQLIASDIGAVSHECVIDTGVSHLFIGLDDFWMFDGATPVKIKAPLRDWFFTNLDKQYQQRIQGRYDRENKRAWWFFPTRDSVGALNAAIVYHTENGKWGFANIQAESIFDYQGAEPTWDEWPPGNPADYDDIPDLPYDSPAWDTTARAFAIVANDHKIKTLNGVAATAHIITGEFGDDSQYTTLTTVYPRYAKRPATSEMTNYTLEYSGDIPLQRGTSALSGNKYDALASGRFHKIKLELTGDFEIYGIDPRLIPDGTQ